jgi:hypothetical protein
MSISNPLAWVRHPSQSTLSIPLTLSRRIRASMVCLLHIYPPLHHTCPLQFCKGPTHRRIRCYQEDYEAIQHTCPLQTHLSRAQTSQAHPTRKRLSPLPFSPSCQFSLFSRSSALATFSSHRWRTCGSLVLSIFPLVLAVPSSPFCQLFRD